MLPVHAVRRLASRADSECPVYNVAMVLFWNGGEGGVL